MRFDLYGSVIKCGRVIQKTLEDLRMRIPLEKLRKLYDNLIKRIEEIKK